MKSNAQTQIDNVSFVTWNVSETLSNLSNTVSASLSHLGDVILSVSDNLYNVSHVLSSVLIVAYSAYNNELQLSETVTNASRRLQNLYTSVE